MRIRAKRERAVSGSSEDDVAVVIEEAADVVLFERSVKGTGRDLLERALPELRFLVEYCEIAFDVLRTVIGRACFELCFEI